MNRPRPILALALGAWWLTASAVALADDWPTFRRDNRRSGVTSETLDLARLNLQWFVPSEHPPEPAWPGPAKWDAYAYIRDLPNMRNYDPVFHTILVGDRIYYGSSTDDAVHCLDATSGEEIWRVSFGGPVRIAPTYVEGKLYFGCDDGYAYCLDAEDGREIWRFRPLELTNSPLVINNGRPVSYWPCRTGVLVDGGLAYFGVSLLPWKTSYLVAVDAETGRPDVEGGYVRAFDQSLTFEAAMLCSSSRLIAPQGRVAPLILNRADGTIQGGLDGGGGGCFALITPDDQVIHGPGNKQGRLVTSSAEDRSKIAAFPSGRSMVVAGSNAYVMTADAITAIDRDAKAVLWKIEDQTFFELIVAGDTLLAGGRDEVVGFDLATGKRTWRADVIGRAHGLAVANGRLVVSTDEGYLHCFAAGAARSDQPVRKPMAGELLTSRTEVDGTAEATDQSPSGRRAARGQVDPVEDPNLIGRWVFSSASLSDTRGANLRGVSVEDLAGDHDATVLGDARLVPVGQVEAIELDGASQSALVTANHAEMNLPTDQVSLEAWVRVLRPETWGGIFSSVRDNGSDETGMLLGYNDDRFSFAVRAAQGPGKLTYLKADRPFDVNRWYHVVGTYDGQTQAVYVNGRLAATSEDQQGPVLFPPETFVEIGAYHDTDEYFRMQGYIQEVRLYDKALNETEVLAHYQAKSSAFPGPLTLASGPYWSFTDPTTAVIHYETTKPVPTHLEYGENQIDRRVLDPTPKTEHTVTLTGLGSERIYPFVIKAPAANRGRDQVSRRYEIETAFNYSVRTADAVDLEPKAMALVNGLLATALRSKLTGKGICLILGSGDGSVAEAIAATGQMHVIGFETDESLVKQSRERLQASGLYGTRVTLLHAQDLNRLPMPNYVANVVLPLSQLQGGPERVVRQEIERLLHPDHGLAALGTVGSGSLEVLTGEPLPATGEWTHQYGSASNAAYSGESLMGATGSDDFEVQWIGRPGPRYHPERNGRKPAPLAANGRLFTQGLGRLIAIDSFNGTILWSLELPEMLRMNLPRDSSNWCIDDNFVYAAINGRCWQIDAGTGEVVVRHEVVAPDRDGWQFDWGYLAQDGELIVATAVKRDAAYTNFWGGLGWYDTTEGPLTDKVCSDNLFARRKADGSIAWTYEGGLIVNPTITLGGDRVYFVESRDEEAIAGESRRLGTDTDGFWTHQYLVALDLFTGERLWDQPLNEVKRGIVMTHVAYGSERVVLSASAGGSYQTVTFAANSGEIEWTAEHDWLSDNHGGHMARPAIVNDRVYVRPATYNLYTGERLEAEMPGGGCGTYAASSSAFFFRSGNITLWDPEDGETTSFSRLRPGCWLSTIPSNGMLLSPEGGGGCSCGSWMETSVGFLPKAHLKSRTDPTDSKED